MEGHEHRFPSIKPSKYQTRWHSPMLNEPPYDALSDAALNFVLWSETTAAEYEYRERTLESLRANKRLRRHTQWHSYYYNAAYRYAREFPNLEPHLHPKPHIVWECIDWVMREDPYG